MQQDKVAEALSKSDSREYRLGTEALGLLCQYFSANCGSYVLLYILLWYFVRKSHITSIVGIAFLHWQFLLFLRDVFGPKTYAYTILKVTRYFHMWEYLSNNVSRHRLDM